MSKYRKRAQELVAQMTLEEKVSQTLYNAPAIERLGIPAYNWWNEALHGVARAGTATVFPQAIGVAATFDEDLAGAMAEVIAEEGRAKYNAQKKAGDRDIYKGLTFWAPNVNIFRDPRWGRGQETYGEDPYLTSRLGVRFVEGLQGDDPDYMKTAACAKHFAVHSGPESLRHSFDAKASKQDMYETYLPAFKACVQEAKVEAVMGAYNRTNGEPCCGSKTLLQDILRDEWGFEGHVVSDCWAVMDFHENHKITKSEKESAAMAMNNGCDLNCGCAFRSLRDAVKGGYVEESRLDEAVTRLMETRLKLGMFEEEGTVPFDGISYDRVDTPQNRALNLKIAEKSLVLLKNENNLLPLDLEKIGAIGVIGPNAASRKALVGNYEGTASRYVTVLEGIQDYVGDRARVFYSEGCPLHSDRGRGPSVRSEGGMRSQRCGRGGDGPGRGHRRGAGRRRERICQRGQAGLKFPRAAAGSAAHCGRERQAGDPGFPYRFRHGFGLGGRAHRRHPAGVVSRRTGRPCGGPGTVRGKLPGREAAGDLLPHHGRTAGVYGLFHERTDLSLYAAGRPLPLRVRTVLYPV